MIDIELINALEDLIKAIPIQDNDHDWWPDELTKAVREARALIQKRNDEMEEMMQADMKERALKNL